MIDFSHQLADIQYTTPPAVVALYNDRPRHFNLEIDALQKWGNNSSTMYFFLQDATLEHNYFGIPSFNGISPQLMHLPL